MPKDCRYQHSVG